MLDLYSNFPINKQADIWALGCVLFAICFNKHPFEDSAKLRIINGNYTIPPNPEFNDYHDLISKYVKIINRKCIFISPLIKGCMFNIDPRQRPTIDEVVYHLENIAESKSVEFQPRLKFLVYNNKSLNTATTTNPSIINSNFNFTQSINTTANNGTAPVDSKWMGNAASLLKGGLKTIKDASTKVIDTMQQ